MRHPDSVWTCGPGGAILKYTAGLVGVTWQHQIPLDYELMQNYPNPFNPETIIKFAIPKTGSITLKIYDITGKEVETILNNMPFNAGTMHYNFNGKNLSSGIYFYTLIVDNRVIGSRKMVLVE